MPEPIKPQVSVLIEGRQIKVRAWRFVVTGIEGHDVPVCLPDTAIPENSPFDQTLTDDLYGGDSHNRLCQEVVLGMAGRSLLSAKEEDLHAIREKCLLRTHTPVPAGHDQFSRELVRGSSSAFRNRLTRLRCSKQLLPSARASACRSWENRSPHELHLWRRGLGLALRQTPGYSVQPLAGASCSITRRLVARLRDRRLTGPLREHQ